MRIFLTGATGAIGSYAAPALVAAGHTVSALARHRQSRSAQEPRGATSLGVPVRP